MEPSGSKPNTCSPRRSLRASSMRGNTAAPATNALRHAQGELKRIDRLVEFDDEVWVLDYKFGDSEDAARYRAQMQEYRSAMQAVYAGSKVRCALVFADGVLSEV